MSCNKQGTAAAEEFDPGLAGSGGSYYLGVVEPVEFTREELQAMRNKAQAQLNWNAEGTKADLLEDLVMALDLLDALEAREETDLTGVTINNAPCCEHCPCTYGHGVGD